MNQEMNLDKCRTAEVLIVGAGLTGSLISRHLQGKVSGLSVWEKAEDAGGRMYTHRQNLIGQPCADLGAQVEWAGSAAAVDWDGVSVRSGVYRALLELLLQRFSGKKIGNSFHSPSSCHYVAPQGLSSCVKHFLPGKSTYFNRRVKDLTLIFEDGDNVKQNTAKWKATADDGTVGLFNAVIVTQPLPQLMNGDISGDIMSLLDENMAGYLSIEAASFSSRYALAIYYPEECQQLIEKIPWTVNYVDGHDCIRYVSLESRKLGKSGCPAVILHSTVPYGISNIGHDHSEVEAEMISYAGYYNTGTVLGGIQLGKPLCTKLVQWRYSQCRVPVSGAPGAVLLNRSPTLVVAGDAFTSSNFDGCVASAEAATDAVMEALTLLKPLSSSH